MPFERPAMREVELQKLIRVHGLVGEIDFHMSHYNINHPAHAEYVNSRLKMLDEMLSELRGKNQVCVEAMD